MTLDADAIVERRRLKRRLAGWRIAALLAIGAAIALLLGSAGEGGLRGVLGLDKHVARVKISGFIQDDFSQQELFRKLSESASAKAVILRIDSYGGTTAGGEALYHEIRKLGEKKPVVAVFGTAATSAAYMIAVAADHIISRANTITGSIGVILQWAEISKLLEKVGVDVEQIRSGPLKAVPSPFEPATERAREVTSEVLQDSYKWFISVVTDRRALRPAAIEELKTGRIYSGRQALEIGLVDQIGGEREARSWLFKTHAIPKDLPIRNWEPERENNFSWFRVAAAILADVTGMAQLRHLAFAEQVPATATKQLDGLLSVWQPQK